jgi:hypothetical protein
MKPATRSLFLWAWLATAAAQPGPAPGKCQGVERRQFDFWIGRWEVFTPDGRKVGDNLIEVIDGGCALIERWRGAGGFTGTGLNSWDDSGRRWHQHWVDNQGGTLRLSGGLDGARMVMSSSEPHPDKPGATLHQRVSWTPLPDGAVRQLWETSEDERASWIVAFDGRYVKAP